MSHGLPGTQTEDAELAEDDVPWESPGPARRDPVTFGQEALDPRRDVVVDGAMRRRAGAVVEVPGPAFQQSVQLDAHIAPGFIVAPVQDLAA